MSIYLSPVSAIKNGTYVSKKAEENKTKENEERLSQEKSFDTSKPLSEKPNFKKERNDFKNKPYESYISDS